MQDKAFESTNVLPDPLRDADEDVNRPMPGLPMSLPGLNVSPAINPLTNSVAPDSFMPQEGIPNTFTTGTPYVSTLKDQPSKPGWFEQVGHDVLKYNIAVQAGKYAYNSLTQNKSVEIVPEGWKVPVDELENFPERYFAHLYQSTGPNDYEARKQKVREQMVNDERFENGSMFQTLLAGVVSGISDPVTYFMPYAVGLKYAKISQNVFLNMERAAGGVALDSLSRNMLIQANREGGNLQDAMTDSMADFIFGSALVGIGAAAGGGLRNAQLWNMRKTMKHTAKGVNIDPVIKKVKDDEIITGFRASMAPGYAEDVEAIAAANMYIDESMKMGGVFAIPGVGQSVSKFLAWGPLASPVLKAAASPYPEVKRFFNGIMSHGIITEGESRGIARRDSASDFAEYYADEARGLSQFIRGQYFEANGIMGGVGVKSTIENMKQTMSKGKTVTEEQFGQEVRRIAYEKDYQSPYRQAHAVADKVLDFYEKMGIDYHEALGEGTEFLDPRQSWKYLPQNYNIPALINDPKGFIDTTAHALVKQDELIAELSRPIDTAKFHIGLLKDRLKDINPENKAQITRIQNEIKKAEGNKFRHENLLVQKIRENPDYHILLEDRIMFDEQEREQLNAILEPIRNAERLKVVAEAKLRPLEKEYKIRKEDAGVRQKYMDAKAELEAAAEEILNQKRMLADAAMNRKIDRKFFTYDNAEEGGIKFHDPNKKPTFRARFESREEINQYAKQLHESILNQSPMDLLQNVLGRTSPGIVENPSVLKKRSVMINSQIYNAGGYLDADIAKSVTAYAQTMGKIIGFKKAFPEYATSKNYEGILSSFKETHEARRNKILEKEPSKERSKELNKLQKEFEGAQNLMRDTYNVYMGTSASKNPKLSPWIKSLKNLTVSAKLGAVPIYQITELASIALKQGLMPFMAQGLRPMLTSMNGLLKTKESEAFKANAANAYIGLWNVRNGYAQRLANGDAMSHPPYRTAGESFGVATDNVAHMSGNLYGINQIANMNEGIVANLFQSEVMQAAFAHQNGTITLKQRQKMARYGIQIEKDGPVFIKSYKDAGGWEVAGGHQSLYYEWADAAASNRMAMSMRRAVKDTVLNANVFASPYWSQNPILGMIFMFHGWAYNALNHYTIPLMQRPDAEAMLGIVGVVGMSLMSEPLLRLANGKEAFDDDETWFQAAFKAVDYSGLVGPYANQFQALNAGLGNIVPGLQTERAKNYGTGIVGSGGPVAGYLNDVVSSTGHLLKNDWTESTANRAERLLPFSSAIPIRTAIKNYIGSFNLPQS